MTRLAAWLAGRPRPAPVPLRCAGLPATAPPLRIHTLPSHAAASHAHRAQASPGLYYFIFLLYRCAPGAAGGHAGAKPGAACALHSAHRPWRRTLPVRTAAAACARRCCGLHAPLLRPAAMADAASAGDPQQRCASGWACGVLVCQGMCPCIA